VLVVPVPLLVAEVVVALVVDVHDPAAAVHASADANGAVRAAVTSVAPISPQKSSSFNLVCNSLQPFLSVVRLCATPGQRVTAFAKKHEHLLPVRL
jgi:hypothetical protein